MRRPARQSADPTVLFVGRLDEEKRVGELLRALPMVPGLRAEIIGDGSCRVAWEALAARLHVTDRVPFRGFVSEDGRPVVLANAMALPHLCLPGRNGSRLWTVPWCRGRSCRGSIVFGFRWRIPGWLAVSIVLLVIWTFQDSDAVLLDRPGSFETCSSGGRACVVWLRLSTLT
ncbi:glycosyltransferase [Actinophytocola algeriensis]|uniref:glycosyltransferase n=1 Tax=Actinophytocola algeriensis TaxID=1768010 RepID=UPI0028937940|nr:glycosyltransferase [Actinophytocola algeriensis]